MCLDAQLQLYGLNHVDVARTYGNMALDHQGQGIMNKAFEFYQKSMTIQIAVLGSDHPDVAVTLCQMRDALRQCKQLPNAILMYDEAVRIYLASSGPDHPDVAMCNRSLGSVYQEQHFAGVWSSACVTGLPSD
jgi:hypothetical protein